MKQLKTKAIVLNRINYGEADRIITVLTPDYGKLRLIARGSRALKSKLAGGIELFSVSDISYILGRGEVATLVSSRLCQHYPRILMDIERVQLGYELLKLINKTTEDQAESDYFALLASAFVGLDDPKVPIALNRLWFNSRLLLISGHAPNLRLDAAGSAATKRSRYGFDVAKMAFDPSPNGRYGPNHIKFWRIVLSADSPELPARVNGGEVLTDELLPLTMLLASDHL